MSTIEDFVIGHWRHQGVDLSTKRLVLLTIQTSNTDLSWDVTFAYSDRTRIVYHTDAQDSLKELIDEYTAAGWQDQHAFPPTLKAFGPPKENK